MNTWPRLSHAIALAMVSAFAFVAGSSLPASAHSDLVASSPAQGETLAEVTAVSLTFAEEIVPEYTTLGLTTEAGVNIPLNAPTMDATNTTVTAALTDGVLSDGSYALGYYIVSIDGHPIEGTVGFVVAGAPAPEPAPSASTSSDAATETPEETGTPVPISIQPRDATAVGGNPDLMWVWMGTGIAAVVVLASVSAVLLVAIRRRRNDESGDPGASGN